VNRRPGRRRALRDIERDLVGSDPPFDELFRFFSQLASGESMPRLEKIRTRRLRLPARLRRRSDRHRAVKCDILRQSSYVGLGGGCHVSDGAILEAQASWLPANRGLTSRMGATLG